MFSSVHLHKRQLEAVSHPILTFIGYNPAPVGSTVTIRCKANGQYPIRWYKNGILFESSNNDQRIYVSISY